MSDVVKEIKGKQKKDTGIFFLVTSTERENMFRAAKANKMSLSAYLRNLHRLHVQSHITYHPYGGPLLCAARTLLYEVQKISRIASESGNKLTDLDFAIKDLETHLKPFE